MLFIHGYARNVIFHEAKSDPELGVYDEQSNWVVFFEGSLPFQLALFSKTDNEALQAEYRALSEQLGRSRSLADLKLLFGFIYNEWFEPVASLSQHVRDSSSGFNQELNSAINARFVHLVERYATLRNTAAKYLCIEKLPPASYTKRPWEIPIEKVFQLDERVKDDATNEEVIKWFSEQLSVLVAEWTRSFRSLVEKSANYIESSLEALDKRNEPHLGLLFAFIRLYTHFSTT